jgi:hypothetical protein
LVGVWNIESYNKISITGYTQNANNTYTSQGTSISQINSYNSSTNVNEIINNNLISITSNESNSQNSASTGNISSTVKTKNGTGNVIASIEFDKDGTFTRTIEYSDIKFTINSQNSSSGFSFTEVINSTEKKVERSTGTWEFMAKLDNEYKNKERIILKLASSVIENSYADDKGQTINNTVTYSYTSSENSEIWILTTLGKNEIEYNAEFNLQSNSSDKNAVVLANSSEFSSRNGSTTQNGKVTAILSK